MKFAEWMQKELDDRGWSQSEMARRSNGGFTQSSVSGWTTGRRIPDPDSCEMIADALHIGVDTVLWHAGHRNVRETLSPDDPRRILSDKIMRVKWNSERVALVGGILDQMIGRQAQLQGKAASEVE